MRMSPNCSRPASAACFGCFSTYPGTPQDWASRSRGRQCRSSGRIAQQLSHPHQIIGAEDQHPAQPHPGGAPFARPPQASDLLGPSEDFLLPSRSELPVGEDFSCSISSQILRSVSGEMRTSFTPLPLDAGKLAVVGASESPLVAVGLGAGVEDGTMMRVGDDWAGVPLRSFNPAVSTSLIESRPS